MKAAAEKDRLLTQAGYRYHFDRMIYFHPDEHKAFSIEYVEDHPTDHIRQCLSESRPNNGWTFYFNAEPSRDIAQDLEHVLNS